MRTQILSSKRVNRLLDRLAYEVIERNRGASEIEILGVRTRGHALAQQLAERISAVENRTFNVGRVDIKAYRDDLDPGEAPKDESAVPVDITGRDLVLVDDVIYTGRTARAALDATISYGRPRSIQFLVLVDRGHREYPVHPDYAGVRYPTKYTERVIVEVDPEPVVYLEEDE